MNYETRLCIKVAGFLFPFFFAIIRLLMILPAVGTPPISNKDIHPLSELPCAEFGSNIMVLLGSGGHTGEMLRILSKVNLSNLSRTWVTSSGDTTSLQKCMHFEEKNLIQSNYKASYVSLKRARRIGEPLFLSIRSTIMSFKSTIETFRKLPQLPSVLLLNGPGTGVPLAYLLFMMKFFGICNTKIIYIESLARVNSLSLSGLLLLPVSDRFIVQWEKLHVKYNRAEYYGILI